MIEKLQATNEYVFIIKDEIDSSYGGLTLPDTTERKPNTGTILSVGKLVMDKSIKKGKKAVFQKQVGGSIEMFGVEVTFLNGNQHILGVYGSNE